MTQVKFLPLNVIVTVAAACIFYDVLLKYFGISYGYCMLTAANTARMLPGPVQLQQGSNNRIKEKQPWFLRLTVLFEESGSSD